MLLQESIHLFLQFRGQGVTAREDALQEAEVHPIQGIGAEQRLKQGGHAGDQVGFLLFQNFRIGFYVKLGHQNTSGPPDEGGVNANAQAEAMENGHDRQHLHPRHGGVAGGGNGLQA